MTAPTKKLRATVYARDKACLSCGTTDNPSFQHRAASGMGGRGKKAPPLTAADGCWLCILCNGEAETSAGQGRALALGYKIRRNRGNFPAHRIPVYERSTRFWWLLDENGGREAIQPALAAELLGAAGSILEFQEGGSDGRGQDAPGGNA